MPLGPLLCLSFLDSLTTVIIKLRHRSQADSALREVWNIEEMTLVGELIGHKAVRQAVLWGVKGRGWPH